MVIKSSKLNSKNYKNSVKLIKTNKKSAKLKSSNTSKFSSSQKIKKNLISPNYWVLPNRKKFIEWIDNNFEIYKSINKNKLPESDFFPHQELIKNYLQLDSPYRGLLLYHSLGSGKSCSSILTAESYSFEKKIVVMLPASLEKNYIEELKKCGSEHFRLLNNWTKMNISSISESDRKQLVKTCKRINGVWTINKSKKSNYHLLTDEERKEVNFQIEELISNKYTFIHYNGLRLKNVEKFEQDNDFFNNKIIIVDEIHNLISMIVGNGIIGSTLYRLLMKAEDSKFIFLSGTPIINYPFELAILFNLLRGYIRTYNFKIYRPNNKWTNQDVNRLLLKNGLIDQIFANEKDNSLMVTPNERTFINKIDNNKNIGVIRNKLKDDNLDFMREVSSYLENDGYLVKGKYQKDFTCFPENEDEFNAKFVHPLKFTIRNGDIFKRRILGTVSYFKPSGNSFVPSIRKETIVKCQMSGHQTLKYIQLRSHEIEREIKRGRIVRPSNNDKNEKENACFRVFSRQCCNFVFPDQITRPFPTDTKNEQVEILELDTDNVDNLANLDYKQKKKIIEFELEKQQAFEKLDRDKDTYLHISKLGKYSQKFVNILTNLQKSEGTSFIYSQFRSLEGIGILALVLEANGYSQFRVRKNTYTKEWEEYFLKDEDKRKAKFAYYTGTETVEEKELIKKIFNNEYDNLPKSFQPKVKSDYNLYGDIIKVLLATSSAAEGINLKNVRQVHIVESYWNPIRIQQVKGRAIRYKSHIQLPENKRNVDIFQYLSILDKKEIQNVRNVYKRDRGMSSDEMVEEIASRKKNITNSFLKLIKETSIDCNLHSLDDTKCYNFGQYHTEYSFVPDINREVEDIYRDRQIEIKNFRGALFKLKSQTYVLNKDNKDIYDYESYKKGRYIKIGYLNSENKPVFNK